MKRIALLMGGVLAFAGVAHAGIGPLSFGVKAGLRFPSQSIEMEKLNIDKGSDFMFGYHLGGELLFHLPVIGLEVEGNALFSRKGAQYSYGEGKMKLDVTRTMYYLDFPLKLNYALGFANTGIFIGVGPTFSVGIGGKEEVGENLDDIVWNKDGEGFSRFDVAISGQLGVRFMGAQLSAFYDYGLGNISKVKDVKIHNKMFGVSLAYLF